MGSRSTSLAAHFICHAATWDRANHRHCDRSNCCRSEHILQWQRVRRLAWVSAATKLPPVAKRASVSSTEAAPLAALEHGDSANRLGLCLPGGPFSAEFCISFSPGNVVFVMPTKKRKDMPGLHWAANEIALDFVAIGLAQEIELLCAFDALCDDADL